MTELSEKQFELDGVVFGLDAPIGLKDGGWQPGQASARTSDVDRLAGDGVRMGRDRLGAATWAFSLYTDAQTEEEAWGRQADLMAAWDAEDTRSEPDAVLPLRYRVAGQTRRVYGRPRRYTPTINNLSMQGRIEIECDFTLTHPLVFGDEEYSSPAIPIGTPLDPEAGLTVPVIVPFTSSIGASRTESSVTIGGQRPTPVWVKITGPISQAAVRVGGWTAALVDDVEAGNPVTIDGRPWVRSATRQDGGGVRVSPRVTRIAQMWLPPGEHEVVFTGIDPTSSATALVSWREAYTSPR